MKQLLEALTALLKVKTIATMVVAFYFGTQNEKKS